MAAVCAKPGCAERAEVWFVAAPGDRRVRLVAEPITGAVALCSDHLARFTVPAGWDVEDSRISKPAIDPRPKSPEPDVTKPDRPLRRPWFASDEDLADTDTEGAHDNFPDSGRMLSRAFNGPQRNESVSIADELEARRLVRLGRIEHQVDGIPERARERIEHDGHDESDPDTDSDQRADSDVGGGDHNAHHEHDEQEAERHDGVDSYGTNELPFPPFETDFAPSAAIG